MAFDERARRRLADILEAHLGDEGSELLMTQLPPQGWDELATKTGLALLKTDLALLRADLEMTKVELHSEITTGLAGVRTDLYRVAAGQLVATIAAMAGLLALFS